MRSPVIAIALTIAVACSGYAFAESQPLTRADCEKAGIKWNDVGNVCGGGEAAAAAAAPAAAEAAAPEKVKKKGLKEGEKKIVKKVTTSHGTKKTVIHNKGHHHGSAEKMEKRGFFQWLNGKNKKS